MILVAGGNGYLGQAVCRKLVEYGQSILCLDISSAGSDLYTSIVADIRDRNELEKVFIKYPIKTVVNLAAILATGSDSNPFLSFQVNILGNYHLLNLCDKYSVSRYVFGSSYAALGNPLDPEKYVDEDEHPNPNSFYSLTKDFVEKFGVRFSELCGFHFIAARLPIIVGPGKATPTSAWRADMFRLLLTGGVLFIDYAPDQVLPLMHHEDAAESLALLILRKKINHNLYHMPYESWRLSELGHTLTSINPSLHVSFGTRKFEAGPIKVSYKRIAEELNIGEPSLRKRFMEFIQ